MTDETDALIHRLIGDHPDAATEVRAAAVVSTSTPLLVAAGILAADLTLLGRAATHATGTRDRQLVAVAEAHVRGDAELLHVLVREHLTEHPDHLMAAWIAGRQLPTS